MQVDCTDVSLATADLLKYPAPEQGSAAGNIELATYPAPKQGSGY